jgi:predicted adenine nucleotide alpha hydrolase (AANH) superfamily ATPase
LLRTSSFPSGFKAQNFGTAQFATTILDSRIKNVTAVIQMTNTLKTFALSNSVKTRINLGQVGSSF